GCRITDSMAGTHEPKSLMQGKQGGKRMSIDVNCTAWKGFHTGEWRHLVNVRNFIQKNYTPYTGDESFLSGVSPRTAKVWEKASVLITEEIKKGIIDVDTHTVSGIDNFAPGY